MIIKRRFLTLMEMLVVITLIALITGVLAYNYQAGLEEGKAMKTKTGMERVENLLDRRVTEEPELFDDVESQWVEMIKSDPLVKDPDTLIYDGWGQKYKVEVENNQIKVTSDKYNEYKRSKKKGR